MSEKTITNTKKDNASKVRKAADTATQGQATGTMMSPLHAAPPGQRRKILTVFDQYAPFTWCEKLLEDCPDVETLDRRILDLCETLGRMADAMWPHLMEDGLEEDELAESCEVPEAEAWGEALRDIQKVAIHGDEVVQSVLRAGVQIFDERSGELEFPRPNGAWRAVREQRQDAEKVRAQLRANLQKDAPGPPMTAKDETTVRRILAIRARNENFELFLADRPPIPALVGDIEDSTDVLEVMSENLQFLVHEPEAADDYYFASLAIAESASAEVAQGRRNRLLGACEGADEGDDEWEDDEPCGECDVCIKAENLELHPAIRQILLREIDECQSYEELIKSLDSKRENAGAAIRRIRKEMPLHFAGPVAGEIATEGEAE